MLGAVQDYVLQEVCSYVQLEWYKGRQLPKEMQHTLVLQACHQANRVDGLPLQQRLPALICRAVLETSQSMPKSTFLTGSRGEQEAQFHLPGEPRTKILCGNL